MYFNAYQYAAASDYMNATHRLMWKNGNQQLTSYQTVNAKGSSRTLHQSNSFIDGTNTIYLATRSKAYLTFEFSGDLYKTIQRKKYYEKTGSSSGAYTIKDYVLNYQDVFQQLSLETRSVYGFDYNLTGGYITNAGTFSFIQNYYRNFRLQNIVGGVGSSRMYTVNGVAGTETTSNYIPYNVASNRQNFYSGMFISYGAGFSEHSFLNGGFIGPGYGNAKYLDLFYQANYVGGEYHDSGQTPDTNYLQNNIFHNREYKEYLFVCKTSNLTSLYNSNILFIQSGTKKLEHSNKLAESNFANIVKNDFLDIRFGSYETKTLLLASNVSPLTCVGFSRDSQFVRNTIEVTIPIQPLAPDNPYGISGSNLYASVVKPVWFDPRQQTVLVPYLIERTYGEVVNNTYRSKLAQFLHFTTALGGYASREAATTYYAYTNVLVIGDTEDPGFNYSIEELDVNMDKVLTSKRVGVSYSKIFPTVFYQNTLFARAYDSNEIAYHYYKYNHVLLPTPSSGDSVFVNLPYGKYTFYQLNNGTRESLFSTAVLGIESFSRPSVSGQVFISQSDLIDIYNAEFGIINNGLSFDDERIQKFFGYFTTFTKGLAEGQEDIVVPIYLKKYGTPEHMFFNEATNFAQMSSFTSNNSNTKIDLVKNKSFMYPVGYYFPYFQPERYFK